MPYDVWHAHEIPGSPGVFMLYVLPIYFDGIQSQAGETGTFWTVV